MKINPNSWHCRIYLWWYERKYHQANVNGYSNLCPYMRAVLFWAPIRFMFSSWIKWGRVPVNAITIPLLLYGIPTIGGYFSYGFKRGTWIMYGMLLVIFSIFALLHLGDKYGDSITKPLTGSGFWKLISAYFRSAHDRVCPEINWRGE